MARDPALNSVRVLLFARYADLMGRQEIDLDPGVVPSVSRLLAHLRALPGGDGLPEQVLVAVNRSHVKGDVPLVPGDEVAVLPPLAGG